VVLSFALGAQAGDGKIEINQQKALAGGVTSCDTAGFPVSICAPGAYVLTSDLDYDSASSSGIEAHVFDVSIDLNGMAVRGSNSCTPGPSGWVTSCALSLVNFYKGIGLTGRGVIENGRVIGAKSHGIEAGPAVVVRNVLVSDSGGYGIAVGDRARVSQVIATSNLAGGVALGGGSATDVVASYNGGAGMTAGGTATLEQIVAEANGSRGIHLAGLGCQLSGFAAKSNAANGVFAADGAVVTSGAIRDNGVADSNFCGLEGSGGASFRGVNITAGAGGNPATACGMANAGGNFCQGVPCP
jgi:hypothetical protein